MDGPEAELQLEPAAKRARLEEPGVNQLALAEQAAHPDAHPDCIAPAIATAAQELPPRQPLPPIEASSAVPLAAGLPAAPPPAAAAAPERPQAAPEEAANGIEAAPAAAPIGFERPAEERPPAANGTAAAAAPAAEAAAPDTYCAREMRHKEREATGELGARYVHNDGSAESGRLLTGLKNVFSKCLPNMPKTYIARLVFDRRHRSVVIVRNGTTVIGGIAYRPFHERRFAEIAFCAVAQSLQVAGFGTRLMNWTKHFARQEDGCEYFLTYADNNAVGYFAKQGFTKGITMPKDRWHGFIKDYDGGTLMECYIHPALPFTHLPEAVAAQRAALAAEVQKYSSAHVVHPGVGRWKEGGGPGSVPPLAIGDIEGVREAGWSEAVAMALAPRFQVAVGAQLLHPTREALAELMGQLVAALEKQADMIWPFLHPVDPAIVPDYRDVIKDPIDLSTIKGRLASGNFYTTLDIFVADVQRMFHNAKVYNAPDTLYYKHAHKLAAAFQQRVNAAVHYEQAAP